MNHRVTNNLRRPVLAFALGALGALHAVAQPGGDEPPAGVSVVVSHGRVYPGDQFPIAIIFEFKPGLHAWPDKPVVPKALLDDGFEAIPTVVRPTGEIPGVRVGAPQWPEPYPATVEWTGSPVEVLVLEGRVVAYLPVSVAADAPTGSRTLTFFYEYQACDDHQCFQPESGELTAAFEIVPLPIEAAGPASPLNQPEVFAGFDPASFASGTPAPPPVAQPEDAALPEYFEPDIIGWRPFKIPVNAYWIILPVAFIAGLLLNLTPCVLPVVPLKILSLQQQARTPGRLAILGTVYCAGIVATFAFLGLLIFGVLTGGQKQDWGQIFSSTWFTLAMALIIGALGVGTMGAFTVRLPQVVYRLSPTHDSLHGNFLMGVLTAVLSTPCTGPMLGATVAWSATQPPAVSLATFVVMGLGMASPYALLVLFPRLVDRLPRGGPGGELLKQVLGILLIAVAVFLAANATSARWPFFVAGATAAAGFLWAIAGALRTLRSRRGKIATFAVSLLALPLIASGTIALARPSEIPWTVFAGSGDGVLRAALDEARADGRIVVIDFTARWCTNCHVIEARILNSKTGKRLLTRSDVRAFKVDLSGENEEGWALVREISGGGGIPLIAIFRPGEPAPVYFQSFFLVGDLERAINGPGDAPRGPARANQPRPRHWF